MMGRLLKAAILGLLTGLLGVGLTLLPFGSDLEENMGLHLLFKLRGARQPPPEVVIVAVDRVSSVHLRLPNDPRKWPRSLHARLTETLAKEGAIAIAFDVFFDEAKSAQEDEPFAEAIQKAGNVVLSEYLEMERVSLLDKERGPPGDLTILKVMPPVSYLAQSAVALAPFPLSKVPIKVHQYWTFKTGAGDTPTLPVVTFQIFALEVYDEFIRLMEKAHPSGVSTLPRHREEIVQHRNVEKVVQEIREIFDSNPGLGEKMLREFRDQVGPSYAPQKKLLLQSLIRMYQSANREYINFYGPPGTITTIPYYEVLEESEKPFPARRPFDFRGKAVFIGHSERFRLGQKDGFYTDFSQSSGLDLSGVEIAATAFSNLLTDLPVHPIDPVSHLILTLFWGVAIGLILLLLPTGIAASTTIGLSLLYLLFAREQFNATATWYPIVLPLLIQFPLASFGAVLWQYINSNKERQNIRKAFGYYLPNGVVDQLSKNIANIKTSHQVVYGICLSTDAEHYTSLSEAMDPSELGNFMNRYYEAVFKPIKQRGGIVANVIGDSVLAIWVASHSDTPLKKEACLAALEIAETLHQFNQSSGPYQLPTRIGLHSGPLLLRHIGAMDHYEYRPVGDIVNTATRIEGLNKYLGTQILGSDEVIRQLPGFLTREIGTFLLAGKSKPLVLHGLFCPQEDTTEAQRTACAFFEEAVAAFRKQFWDEAIEKFHRSMECFGQDGPSSFYVKLCKEYKMNPPGTLWDGVVQMDKK
jgi:adenylate cyclase